MPGRVSARPGLTPSLSQNSQYEFQQFKELTKKRLPAAYWRALFLALFPLPAHEFTPFAAC
jgi:hypothetical protein